jgi:hypothetical protein
MSWTASRGAWFRDPEGNLLAVGERRDGRR